MTKDTLDAIGLLCPLPVLKLSKQLKTLEVGDIIEMQADDPAALVDVPFFCNEAGHELLSTKEDGSVQIYRIKKGQ